MLYSPEDYPEPTIFRPERFLLPDGSIDHSVRDPAEIAFGFGRRYASQRVFFVLYETFTNLWL